MVHWSTVNQRLGPAALSPEFDARLATGMVSHRGGSYRKRRSSRSSPRRQMVAGRHGLAGRQ
jgi:hypothetical protein